MVLRLVQFAVFIFVTGWTIQVSLDNHLNTSGLASSIVGVTSAVFVTLIWETFRAIGNAAQRLHSRPRQEARERVEPVLHPPEAQDEWRPDFRDRLERDGS